MKVLSINQENIEEAISNLEKVQALAKYLEFPPMVEREEKLKALIPIERQFAEQGEEYLLQEEQLKIVLEAYNQGIKNINLNFMYLESLVADLENKK